MAERILVLVVDRDDDVGVKTGIKGPIIGEAANIEAATKLAIADPEDSDANTIFAAVKTYRELKNKGKDVEIATVTGHRALGFLADNIVNNQLKHVFDRYRADAVVLVTDGAEDDQVIPIILSYAPIISKRNVVVRQAVQLEKTYYAIKNAIRDKDIAPILFGVPGIAFLLWAIFGNLGMKLIFGIIGAYFVAIATGLDTVIMEWVRAVIKGISLRGPGAPFYFISLALLAMAVYSAYRNIIALTGELAVYEAIRSAVGFASLSAIMYLAGRIIDAHRNKKAFLIGKHLRYGAVVVVLWVIVDAVIRILTDAANITDLYVAAIASVLFYVVAGQIAEIFEESIKRSTRIEGVSVYDRHGVRIGQVKEVKPEEGVIIVQSGNREIRVPVDKVGVDVKGVILGM
ncbi:MAG TPA: DUF373 family protein [Euryarchaeota archaeon]|nr:DUF373 family protein [Euryarchaeota archaeon]